MFLLFSKNDVLLLCYCSSRLLNCVKITISFFNNIPTLEFTSYYNIVIKLYVVIPLLLSLFMCLFFWRVRWEGVVLFMR